MARAILRLCLSASALAFLMAPAGVGGFLVGVDLGSQYFKAAVVAPGKPFEVVHNQHSKRKTPTAVSFNQKVRAFGDDAIASAMKGVPKTPMFFPLELGRNLTGVAPDEFAWMPKRFYPFSLGANESGSLNFQMGDDSSVTVEEAAGHLLSFVKHLATEAADGAKVSESVLTVPSQATFNQRRAMLAAAKIAGLPRAQLLHETSAAALQRALDLDLSGVNGTANESLVLFYNMGARHAEVCVVHYTGAKHMGKNTVAMSVRGCGFSRELGGHLVDMAIAQRMLEAFKAKQPKLAEGIEKSVRALKKLEKEAMGTKHVLSANKDAQFRTDSLYEDVDFAQPVSRANLEEWCFETLAAFNKPIETALSLSNVSLTDIDTVEMIGGGWRIPKVQSLLSEYFAAQRPKEAPALNLSQHINGDEAMATGAAFYGANSSASFRTKKIFFTDATPHAYSLELIPLNASQPHEEGWKKSLDIFPAGSKLRARKTVKMTVRFDLRASILENGNLIMKYDLEGVHEAATGKYANLSTPLVSLKFELDPSGIVQLTSATAIFDENVTVEEIVKTPMASANGTTTAGNASAADAETAEGAGEGGSGDGEASAEASSGATGAEDAGEAKEGNAAADAAAAADSNATESSNSSSVQKVLKTKIKKRKVTVPVVENFDEIRPRPLSKDEILGAINRLAEMDAGDAEVQRIDAAKNTLEAFIYESRDKINDDENCLKVSTEDQRSKVSEALTAMEDWLYEDEAREANASLLEDKLRSLQELVVPIRERAVELEQRALLPELIDKVKDYVNMTLAYVEENMTWVAATEREGVANLTSDFVEWYDNVSKLQTEHDLTEEPLYKVMQVKQRLHRMQSEAQRLTKIRKIDPMPYTSDSGKYGGDYWKDPRMRKYYDDLMKNMSGNGTNYSDWFRNFSNFSNFGGMNNSEYMRSFYEHAARNFSSESSENASGSADDDGKSEL
mmetsp:Transcript_66518/g.192036  ORF Transcript_66518/g.192036 Transcript_66518/m.192036 type:complete len:962 (-) Transcript_66518:68-2953(-)